MSTETTSVPFPANTIPIIRKVNVVPANTPPHKFIENRKNKTIVWGSTEIVRRDLLFVRHCTGGSITINAPIAKVLIEGCENMTINLPDKVMTNMLEIWKSKNITINIAHPIYTSQVDMCEDITINYPSKKEYQQVVWSNSNRVQVNFKDCAEHNTLVGLEQMKAIYQDVSDAVDQFYLRFVNDTITSEVMIRLPGGFPSTTREADEWEAQHPHDVRIF